MSDAEYIEERIRDWFQNREFDAFVTSKLTDPLRLLVLQVGTNTSVEAITDNGTWGAVRVGDLVRVKRGAANVASRPYELGGAANTMQSVGADYEGAETTSVSDYETIADVQGMSIPARAFGLFTFSIEVETVGTPGSGDKEFAIVFNNSPIALSSLGTGSGGYFAAMFIGPMATFSGLRSVEGMNALWSSFAVTSNVEMIERIRLIARTQDNNGGTDIVRAENLIIYA